MEQRFEKIVMMGSGIGRGTLSARGDSLTYESKKGTLTMPKVRSLEYNGGRLTVEYGEGGNFQTVQFVDMSKSGFRSNSATRDLERKLRGALQLVPISAEEQAGYTQAVEIRKVAAGKQGRWQMIIGAVLAVAATIVTIVTYANADPGDTYFIWWGGIVFGAILFFQGLAASRSARK